MAVLHRPERAISPVVADVMSLPPRKRGSSGRSYSPSDLIIKIAPGWGSFLYQRYLPSSSPSLDALFPQNRLRHRGVKLSVDEQAHSVSLSEAPGDSFLVFPNPAAQVAGHPDVKRTVPLAGKDVEARLHVCCIMPCFGHPWTAFAGVTKQMSGTRRGGKD
jgi:hypothetical protein